MICQECQIRPAKMHLTKIINGQKTEVHLCEQCAQEKSTSFMFSLESPSISINNLLAGLFNVSPNFQHSLSHEQKKTTQCHHCGMTFEQFLEIGKFGCANCYEVFSDELTPVLRRVQGGNWKHVGKIPKRSGGALHLRNKIEILKETLQSLVAKEEFEKAAQVRDEIRMYEKQLKEGDH